MSWRFHVMVPGDLNIDPIEREFFATEALRTVTDPLVREAIQNSLDAASRETVYVRFALGSADAQTKRRYLGGLWAHARAAIDEAVGSPASDEALTYLVVEDYGTRGLEGDPDQYDDTDDDRPRNDFYYFWRNVGRSRKESTDRGRWGLGKTVFAAASRMHSFFGLTVRESDGHSLLMGQAVLKIHRVAGHRFRPYGYYGVHRNGFTRPVDEFPTVSAFARSFGLRGRDGPGLSIVVPYPDREITAEGLVQSVLEHYFHPLLSGKLRVEVEGPGTSIVLQREGLEAQIQRLADQRVRGILPLIRLARWGLEPEREAMAELSAPVAGRAPKLTSELFAAADLERMRRRYDEGRRIALTVRVPVQRARGEPLETRFELLIERDENIQRGEGHFVRQGITIENSTARRTRGVRWIVVISDAALSTFLGDAENPAHTEWQRSSPKFKEKYHLGPSTIDFVRSVPQNVAAILGRPAEGQDVALLRHVFSLSTQAALETPARDRPSHDVTEEGSTTESDLGELGRGGSLVLSRVKTGFRVKGKAGEGAPDGLRIVAAYEVLRGDAFRRYSPLDFRMDEGAIAVQARGVRIATCEENKLELAIEEPEIEVSVTGFDERRDLRIKIQSIGSGP